MKKIAWLIFLFCMLSQLHLKAQQKPNVLILYTDDLGYGDLSCYGATAISTPHIDWLAQNGLHFTKSLQL